ncbi:MAG: hypothetical protein H6602_14550 [Flavobacteriales bacterium]|nr:hypothetical protein [Flavobacteriales bacterium]
MKQLFTIGLVLLLPGFLTAQKLSDNFKVSRTSPYEVVDAGSKKYFGIGNDQSLAVKTRSGVVTLQKFDVGTKREVDRKVHADFPKYSKEQEILQVEGHLYYISEAFDKKTRTFTVSAREINPDDLSMGELTTLFTTDREVTAPPAALGAQPMFGFGFVGGNKFEVIPSFDGSKFLIRYRLKPLTRKDSESYDELGFYVFDNKLNKLWGKEQKMPYTEKEMNNLAYTVTSDGTAYMLALVRDSKQVELFTITANDFKTKPLDINKDLVFQKFDMVEDDKGNIACVAYYATGIEFKFGFGGGALVFNTNGIYYFKLTPSGEVADARDIEFDIDFINEYRTDREKDKNDQREKEGKAGIPDLKLLEFKVEKDGSVFILGERSYVRNEFYGPKQQTVYHFSNVVATKLNPDGTVRWMKKLPKNQAGTAGRGGMGVKYIRGKNGHYVLFLDNVKNANLKVAKAPEPHKDGAGGFLTAYMVDDETGEIDKHNILDVRDLQGVKLYQFNTTRIFDVSDNLFLLETYIKDKRDMMIKIELNEGS